MITVALLQCDSHEENEETYTLCLHINAKTGFKRSNA